MTAGIATMRPTAVATSASEIPVMTVCAPALEELALAAAGAGHRLGGRAGSALRLLKTGAGDDRLHRLGIFPLGEGRLGVVDAGADVVDQRVEIDLPPREVEEPLDHDRHRDHGEP